jgi:hypothetical protein
MELAVLNVLEVHPVSVCIATMKESSVRLLVFSFLFVEALGIRCFDCNSFNDPQCADPFGNSSSLLTVDCSTKRHPNVDSEATFCRKTYQRGKFQ